MRVYIPQPHERFCPVRKPSQAATLSSALWKRQVYLPVCTRLCQAPTARLKDGVFCSGGTEEKQKGTGMLPFLKDLFRVTMRRRPGPHWSPLAKPWS